MVSGVVAGGIPAAVTAYSKAVDAANAQVLISTTVNALRAEVCTAKDVHFTTGGDLIYISPSTGSKTKLYKGTETGSGEETILVQDFMKYDETGPQGENNSPRRLVTKSAATANLQVVYGTVNWAADKENEVLAFNNIQVKKDNTTVASIDNLYIRCLGVDLTQRTGG